MKKIRASPVAACRVFADALADCSKADIREAMNECDLRMRMNWTQIGWPEKRSYSALHVMLGNELTQPRRET